MVYLFYFSGLLVLFCLWILWRLLVLLLVDGTVLIFYIWVSNFVTCTNVEILFTYRKLKMISESKVLRSTWFATLIILLTNWNFLSVKLLSSHNWMPHWSDTYLHSSCSTSSGVLAQLLLVLLSPNFWVGLKQDEFKIKIYIWIAPGIYEIWSSIPFQCIWLSISGSSIIPHLLHICISFLRLSSCKFMGLPYCICKLDPLYLYIYLSLHREPKVLISHWATLIRHMAW